MRKGLFAFVAMFVSAACLASAQTVGDARFRNLTLTGNLTVSGSVSGGTIDVHTIASNGGGTPATLTLIPASGYVELVCNDTDGCTITMSESGAVDGRDVKILNASGNPCTFSNTSGVSQLQGAFSMNQYGSLELKYLVDRWVEISRSTAGGTVLQFGPGSASVPSFSFASDTNTGVYSIGADDIGISTGGTLRFDINTSRILAALDITPSTTNAYALGSASNRWTYGYLQKAVIGNDSTLANNVLLRHATGTTDQAFELTVLKGDESGLGDLRANRIALGDGGDDAHAGVNGFVVSSFYTHTGSNPATEFNVYKFLSDSTPSANITVTANNLVGGITMRGANNWTGDSQSGLYGFVYSYGSGTHTHESGVIGDAEHASTGTASGVFAFDGRFCCAFDDGSAHGTVARASFFHAAQPFKGTGTITHHDGIWIEDQTAASTYSATTHHSLHIDHPTGSSFLIDAVNGRVTETAIQLAPSGVSKPTCNSANRGTFWYAPGGAGVADTTEVCRKDAGDSYAWVSVY